MTVSKQITGKQCRMAEIVRGQEGSEQMLDYDVIIVGAGIGGLYQLYKLRESGFNVRVFDSADGVGGTWYWNRYPGARFDSESYSYGYSFSEELLKEWDWSEHFASQPEILKYLEYVTEKFDLIKDIQFNSDVSSAIYDENGPCWQIQLSDGRSYKSRFLITAVGVLSEPVMPKIEGRGSFKGPEFHTSRWPHGGVDYKNKKVAIIGTGASGVQTIQELVKDVKHLTVFQRRPNWCAPLHNDRIAKDEMEQIRGTYPEIFQRCHDTVAGFLHSVDSRGTFEVSKEEREKFWEELYASRGFGIWQGNFNDMLTNQEANKEISDFIARKIRERVNDPETAEKLIPKDHGFGTRRVPLETKYYESYNRPNVELVDISESPIERITENGLRVAGEDYEFDLIIYATGFDAIVGSYNRIDVKGADGQTLRGQWEKQLKTFLGLQVSNFPNMFMVMGPHALLGNNPRSLEYNAEWINDLLSYMKKHKFKRAEASESAVDGWAEYVSEMGQGLLSNEVDSWMTGVNLNLEGRSERIIARYSGTAQTYRKRCDEVAAMGYKELNLT